MIIREMSEIDREYAIRWFSLRTGAEVPEDMFPLTGVAVSDRGVLRLVQTVFFEDTSAMAVLGWCAGNPENRPRDSRDAFRLAAQFAEVYARRRGARHLVAIFGEPGINRQLDRIGYLTGDSNVQHKYKLVR